jgi:hypothetical protein
MSTAGTILFKLQRVDVTGAAQRAIQLTKSDAVAAQRVQLSQGLKADGTYQPDYSPVSVSKYGKPPGPIKLYDIGSYYGGLKIEVSGVTIRYLSTDEKNDYLEGLYHPLGLGFQGRINWIRTLKPAFVGEIKKYLS